MPKPPADTTGIRVARHRPRRWPIAAALAAVATFVVLAAGCSSPATDGATDGSGTTGNGSTSGGGGRVSPGGSASPDGNAHGGNVGSFSAEFARCMREHGVPNFPDPNGQAGQLAPNSGIDPASPKFQSALNGPCKSLAPAAWLASDSGPDSLPGGGG